MNTTMKNVLILGVFVGFAAFMNAQNLVPVTFQVDMSNELVSPEGVYVAGSFQGWDAGATPLSDVDIASISQRPQQRAD
jgi:TctA family transporter